MNAITKVARWANHDRLDTMPFSPSPVSWSYFLISCPERVNVMKYIIHIDVTPAYVLEVGSQPHLGTLITDNYQ